MDPVAPLAFECPFGYVGQVEQVPALPTSKAAFVSKLEDEIVAAQTLIRAYVSYQREINSRIFYVFDTKFLLFENKAIIITIAQLELIEEYLLKLFDEAAGVEDGAEVPEELIAAVDYVRPWIQRVRQILIGCHIFYKINFRLVSN